MIYSYAPLMLSVLWKYTACYLVLVFLCQAPQYNSTQWSFRENIYCESILHWDSGEYREKCMQHVNQRGQDTPVSEMTEGKSKFKHNGVIALSCKNVCCYRQVASFPQKGKRYLTWIYQVFVKSAFHKMAGEPRKFWRQLDGSMQICSAWISDNSHTYMFQLKQYSVNSCFIL